MLYKPRTKSSELMILELLKPRMKFNAEDENRLFNLSKGYEGELLFDHHFEQLQNESLILNDLLFEVNNTTFQIDSLIILHNLVYFYEIKYFEGNYYYQGEKIFKKPNREIINPLHQLGRSESLLRQLLLSIGFKPQIISNVIFVHPHFTLYEAPLQIPFIFPTQIKRHIEELNKLPSKISDRHKKLAEKLVDLHIEESRFSKFPDYSFDELRKGVRCSDCGALSVVVVGRSCVCRLCKKKMSMTDTILDAVKEFRILFKDKKITTSVMYEWCGELVSKKIIRKILQNNFKLSGKSSAIHYL